MAPKSSSRSHQPTKEKDEKKQPSVEDEEEETETEPEEEEEEEEDEEEGEQRADGKDEEEDSSSSSTEEEDEEDQGKETPVKTPNPPPKSNSKSTEALVDDGSDSETDSDPSPSNYKVQPISKPSTTAGKRSIEISNGENPSKSNSKKPRVEAKKSPSAAPSTPGAFVRVWSNEDEVAVLKGMAEYKTLKGKSPNSDMEGFYNFIKGKLHVVFSKDQLKTKIRRMKKRFVNAAEKGDNGSDPVFSNPHEDMLFKLSKKIWGDDVQDDQESKDVARSSARKTAKKEILKIENIDQDEKLVVEEKKNEAKGDFWSKYPFIGMSFRNLVGNNPSLAMSEGAMGLIKDNLSLIADSKAKELDEKWKQLIAEEADINYRMLTLMSEQIKLGLDK